MTISTTDNKVSYNGNGVTTVFAFPYLFFANTDLDVYSVSPSGALTLLTPTTDYTVTGAGVESGGTVTTVVPPATGTQLLIVRVLSLTQETDYIEGDAFPAESHERALDRLTMITQQIQEEVDRSIKVQLGGTDNLDDLIDSINTAVSAAAASAVAADASADAAAASAVAADASADAAAASVALVNGPITGSALTMATNRLLGRTTAGSGPIQEITVGNNLSLASGVLSAVPLRGHIDGLTLSTAGASTTMTIAAGQATDSTNAVLMTLASALNKNTGAWAVGSGNGGLDEGTIANNSWYYAHLIQRPDTGVVDAVLSRSHGESATATISIATPGVVTWTAHGLEAGAGVVFSTTGALPTGLVAGTRYYVSTTGLTTDTFQVSATIGGASIATSGTQSGTHTVSAPPALPANYTRRRGSIGGLRTNNSGQWTRFFQTGDEFWWETPVIDFNAPSSATGALATMSVPRGRKMKILCQASLDTSGTVQAYLSDPSAANLAPSTTAAPYFNAGAFTTTSQTSLQLQIWTNTSAQIRQRATSISQLIIVTNGWTDLRGRNA
jgi:hypothetical protein